MDGSLALPYTVTAEQPQNGTGRQEVETTLENLQVVAALVGCDCGSVRGFGPVKAFKALQDAGDGLFIPQARIGPDGVPLERGKVLRHDEDDTDTHSVDDKLKLQGKIEGRWEQKKLNEALVKQDLNPDQAEKIKDSIQFEKESVLKKQKEEAEKKKLAEFEEAKKVVKDFDGHPGARGGEPSDPDVKEKRDKVRGVRKNVYLFILSLRKEGTRFNTKRRQLQ